MVCVPYHRRVLNVWYNAFIPSTLLILIKDIVIGLLWEAGALGERSECVV